MESPCLSGSDKHLLLLSKVDTLVDGSIKEFLDTVSITVASTALKWKPLRGKAIKRKQLIPLIIIKRSYIMAYIYKITNLINGKVYIGQTSRNNPKTRFYEHLRAYKKSQHRPLYRAMEKHGVENFSFDVLEKTDFPMEREMFWIKETNSYGSRGYNCSFGGEGLTLYDPIAIVESYSELKNATDVAKKFDCGEKTVRYILKDYEIDIIDSHEVQKQKFGKKINRLSLDGEFIDSFPSQIEAGRYLIKNNLTGISKPEGVSSKIGLVCRGKRQTFAGFKWEYSE